MCGALCWMLYAWLPPRWAVYGGLLAMLRFGLLSYWMNSYWGGAHAALGGALVLGAVGRLRRQFKWSSTLALGAGMGILLLGRPLEGGVLCAAALVYLATQVRVPALIARVTPGAIVLVAAACFLAVYCYHVTGHATLLPYQVNQKLYGWPMTLITYTPPGTHATQPQLQQYYAWELGEHEKLRHAFIGYTFERLGLLWRFYVGPLLSLSLIGFWSVRRSRRLRPLLWMGGLIMAVLLIEQSDYPHYLAPAACIVLVIVMQGLRALSNYRPEGRPVGPTLVRLLPFALLAVIGLRLANAPLLALVQHGNFTSWCCSLPGHYQREALESKLRASGGQHVVIVRYHEKEFSTKEWVYNHPDFDRAAVIWARDMRTENAELQTHYPERHFWLAEPDITPLRVTDCRTQPELCGLRP